MTQDEKIEYAQRVLSLAQRLLQQHDLGATVLVHDAVLSPLTLGEPVVATSLPSTAHERVVLSVVLVGLCMLDGATPDTAAELVDRDVEALKAGQL
jgi:hypothetical protein